MSSVFFHAWTALLVLATCAYFESLEPGANAYSQFNLTRAIVERGALNIDAYHASTTDKAVFRGHYYCDKSPVNAFLGVPFYALYRALAPDRDNGDENSDDVYGARAQYVVAICVEGVAAALLAVMTSVALRRRGVAPGRAALVAALWPCATPILGYATLFYNYAPACALQMAGFLLVDPARSEAPSSWRRMLVGGAFMGLACWTLNTVAVPALAVTTLLAWRAWDDAQRGEGRTRASSSGVVVRRLAPWVVGAAAGLVGQFVYNAILFGSPWDSPYHHEVMVLYRTYMRRGLMGATWPRPVVAWLVTLHPFQGLFLWFPLTALTLAGLLVVALRGGPERASRAVAVAAIATFAVLLAYVSGYYMWWGGAAYATRHLIPALPLMGLGLAPWMVGRRWLGRALVAVGLAGVVVNVSAIAIDVQPDNGYQDMKLIRLDTIRDLNSPIMTEMRLFWAEGRVGSKTMNLGRRLGLTGSVSLTPLAGAWALALVALRELSRRHARLEKKTGERSVA